jgi:hypothetical protein
MKMYDTGGGVGSRNLDGLETEIHQLKRKLVRQAKLKGISENFGQKEVRMLEDKYPMNFSVGQFDEWVQNFDLDSYAKGGGVGMKYEVKRKGDKHFNEFGTAKGGIEKDKRGVSFVTLHFSNGDVNSYSMSEVNRVFNGGGGVDDYIDEQVNEFDADETQMRQQYRGYVRDIEYQGFLAIDTSLTPNERLSDYEFDGEEFDRDNLLEVAKKYPQAEYITFHARLMGDSDFGIEDELSPIDDLAMEFDMARLNQYKRGGGVGGNRAKSVTHKINGKDRKFPIKDAWRREHNSYNESEKYEIPLSQRKFVGGGGVGGKEKIRKQFDGYYEDYSGEHVVSLVEEEDGSGYYFLDTTNGFSGGVSKSKASTKDALEKYVTKNYNVVKQFNGGGGVGSFENNVDYINWQGDNYIEDGGLEMQEEMYSIIKKYIDFDTINGMVDFDDNINNSLSKSNNYDETIVTANLSFYKGKKLVAKLKSFTTYNESNDEGLTKETIFFDNDDFVNIQYTYGNTYTGFDPKRVYEKMLQNELQGKKFVGGGGVDGNPSKKEMLDYLNMYFDNYSELRTIAIEEDNILTRKMLNSLDDEELEMAYDDAKYEIKADTQFDNGGGVNSGLNYGKKDDVFIEVITLLNSKLEKPTFMGKQTNTKQVMSVDSFMDYIKKYEMDERYEVNVPIELFTKESFNQYSSDNSNIIK